MEEFERKNKIDKVIDEVSEELTSSKYVKKSTNFLKELLRNTIIAIIIFLVGGFILKMLGFI